jgi:RHS repeat-associated protein
MNCASQCRSRQQSSKIRSSVRFSRFQIPAALLLIVSLVQPAHAQSGAAGFVQGNFGEPSQEFFNTMTATYTQPQTAGNLNVVVIGWNDVAAQIQSLTDTAGNTYVLAAGPTNISGVSMQAVYYATNIVASAANTNAVTVQMSANVEFPDVRIAEYSGIDPVNPVDTIAIGSGTGTALDSGYLTTTTNDVLVCAGEVRDWIDVGDPTYVTRMITSGDGNILEDRIVSAGGSYHATALQYGNDAWVMQLVAFRFASGVFAGAVQTNYELFQASTQGAWATFEGAQTAGNLNVVAVSWRNSPAQIPQIGDNEGNTYILAAGPLQTGSLNQAIYYAKNISSSIPEGNGVWLYFTEPATDIEVMIGEYSGMDTVNPLDVTVGAQGSGSTSDSGLVQTINWNDLLIGVNTVDTVTTLTSGTGYVPRILTSPLGDLFEDESVSGAGSYHATGPLSGTGNWIMQMVAFATAAGSGGGSAPYISSLSPNTAPIGSAVTIAGGNFGSVQGSSAVSFNGTVASISSWSSTSITAYVPEGTTSGNVVVKVGTQWSNGVRFNLPEPAATFIQGNSADPVGSQSEVTVPYKAAQLQGDLNVVVAGWQGDSVGVESVTDSLGNTYKLAFPPTMVSGFGGQAIYYATGIVPAAANQNQITVIFTAAATNPDIRIAEYQGLDSQNPIDVAIGANGNTESADSGSVTTTNAYDLLLGASYAQEPAYGTGGYTVRVISTPDNNLLADLSVSATGNYDFPSGICPPGQWILQMVAFRMAAPPTQQNQPPIVNAGPNQTITLPNDTVELNGSATDDGLPNGTLAVTWSLVSGPGTVNFYNPNEAVTEASFSVAGSYVLKLTASDSQLQSSATTTVTVNPAPYPPPTVSAGPNQTITQPANAVTLNGSVTDNGLPITTSWAMVSGPAPVLFGNVSNLITTAMFTTAGVYDLRLSATNGETSASADATITVNPPLNTPASGAIVLSPSSAGPVLTGTAQQLQATVLDGTGTPITNQAVTFTVSGGNRTTGTGTTNATGVATFSYSGTTAGVDAVVATATVGSLGLTSNTSMISWVGTSPTVTASTVQGEFFTSDGSGTFDTPSNAQPVFTQSFASINFNPPSGTIPGMPSTIDVTTTPFTNVTTDGSGNYAGSVIAQGNGLQAGEGALSTFQAVFTGTFNVSAAGNVTFRFLNSDGFVFGVGNGASRVSGSYVYPPSTTAFHGYTVMGSFNTVTAPIWNTVTVSFPAAGSYPFEIDYTNSNQASLIPAASVWKYKVANATVGQISSIQRASGSVNILVNAAFNDLVIGSKVAIAGVSDSTNFPNSTQTVASITQIYQGDNYINPGTRFNVNWPGNDASSSGGTLTEQFNEPFYLIGFDDSSFSLGQAPFTDTIGAQGSVGCPLIGKSLFPVLGTLDLRKTVELPPGATNVKALVAIDNDFTLWVNGTEVINQVHENCAYYWEYTVPIPDNLLHPGPNLIAVQARDRGVSTAFDLSLIGPASLVSAKPLTLVMSTNPNSGQSLLTISPSANLSEVLGQPATFTALVTNASGTPAPSVPVTFNVGGANSQQATMTTNASGIATFTYTGFFAGADTVQAQATVANSALVSTQTHVTWNYQTNLPNNGTLVLSPNSPQTPTLGQSQTFTVEALDGSGNPVPNVPVVLLVSVANTLQLAATTNSSGIATFSYNGATAGTDTVEANTIINGTAAFSNLTTVTWKPQSQQTTYVFTPQGWIGSPAIGTVVQNQTPIILGSGVTLSSGTLKFFPTSNPSNITVLNANTVGTGPLTLGVFDPTLLANGEYTVQLQATSSTGVSQLNEIVLSITGEYKPGRVTLTVTDFKVPLEGIPINISRTYDSLNRGLVEDFGNGWSLTASVQLQIDRQMNVTFTINGKTETFYFTPQSTGQALFSWMLEPKYTPQPGVHGTLTSNGCGILIYASGNIVQDASGIACFPGGTYQPTTYTYTDPVGRVYTMSSTGVLQGIKDLSGNTLTFSSTGITSSAGGGTIVVPFVRDSQNRITQITDLDGNNYIYAYDTCGTGNLCSVTLPGTASIKDTYTYFSDHSLNTQSDPNSNATVYAYYPDSRVQSMQSPSVTGANGSPTQYLTQYAYSVGTNTTTTTNPDGGVVVETDNSFGKPVIITDALGRTTAYTYDSNQNLINQTDGLGKITTYTYDANGNQTSITDPLGNTNTKLYNQYSEVTSATDAAKQNTASYVYDSNFNVKQVTDALGQVYAATYDTFGNAVTQTDANGNMTQLTYDPNGNLIKLVDPLNATTTLTYDAMGRLLTRTDPRANKTTYSYDALGNLVSVTDPQTHVSKSAYDLNGNKTSDTDALTRTTSYAYDSLNRLVQVTYPDTTTKSYVYDFRNNKISETDQAGRTTQYQYDLAGELTSITYALGTLDAGTVHFSYYANGLKQTQTDELGNVTTYFYDDARRLTSVQDALHDITKYGYDADGRRTSVTDARQNTTTYTPDARSRLRTVSYPDTTTDQYNYDGVGDRVSRTDQAGNVTQWSYDQDNRLSSVTDALQKSTKYGYDPAGNLISVVDANTHTTLFQYDSLNRKIGRELPIGMLETFSYDAVGNLSAHTDFNGKTTTFTYDSLNRLLTKIPDSTLSQPTIAFTYSPTGTRQTMTDATGTTNYTYDNRDRLKSKVTPEGTLSYTYDAHGNTLTIASSNTNGALATYAYDVLNRLSTATDNRLAAQGVASPITTYGYDPGGNLAGYAYSANGLQSTYTYDTLNRLSQLAWKKNGTSLSSFVYAPYPAGNVHTVAELSGRNVTYGYDNDYRLQNETIASDPAGNNGAENYTYDNVGNRLTLNSTIPSLSGANSYSYDQNDRLTTDTYDANGNTISSSGISYTYDFENRLLMKGAIVVVYDGDGNRVSETAAGVTTKYLVDTLNTTGYSEVLDELISGAVTKTYTYGLQRISENQLSGSTWTPTFYGYDGHGNARFLANSAGTITDTYTFDAFGAQIASTGTTPNPYLYSGERFDSSLNLYHLRARYYNMLTGRFETMDPLDVSQACCALDFSQAENISDPGTLHKYVYTQNNPVNRIDPTGLADEEENLFIDATFRRYITRFVKTFDKAAIRRICFTATLLRAPTMTPPFDAVQMAAFYFACVAKYNAPFN